MKLPAISLVCHARLGSDYLNALLSGFADRPFPQMECIVIDPPGDASVQAVLREHAGRCFIRHLRCAPRTDPALHEKAAFTKARHPFVLLADREIESRAALFATLREYAGLTDLRRRVVRRWDALLQTFVPVGLSASPAASGSPSHPSKIRLLACTHNLRLQGAQKSLLELVAGLVQTGAYHVLVAAPHDGPLAAAYHDLGIDVLFVKYPGQADQALWERDVARMADGLQRLGVQALIANTLKNFPWIHIAAKARMPSLFVPRESEPPLTYFDDLPSWLKPRAYDAFNLASRVVFVAEATRRQWKFLEGDRPFGLIHNALKTDALEQRTARWDRQAARATMGIGADEVVLLCVGTVSPRKGQKDLIQALPQVFTHATRRFRTIVVGCSPPDPHTIIGRYMRDILELYDAFPQPLRHNTLLYPETDRLSEVSPVDFYQVADVAVFCSRIESYPRVILEAMYFGLPLVTTPCFGVAEQCVENVNALYYTEGDVPTLAKHILALMEDDALRGRLARGSTSLFNSMPTYGNMVRQYDRHVRESLVEKIFTTEGTENTEKGLKIG